jgi:soluble lytic murein transglycosylase-like protein
MSYYEPQYDYYEVETPFNEPRAVAISATAYLDSVHRRMLLILGMVLFVIVPLLVVLRLGVWTGLVEAASLIQSEAAAHAVADNQVGARMAAQAAIPAGQGISPVFSREVRYWEAKILAWSAEFNLDPNIAATIMQIESCGDPNAVSSAGAQGLFQVMPFHFAAGEQMQEPDNNARRGLNYFVERMQQTNNDIGRSFAGYNGGHRAAGSNWNSWANETQRYYVWSTGIYGEASAGLASSPTLQRWLEAGGASLCRQAAARLGI